MARGFGARESVGLAASAADMVSSVSKIRSEIDSLQQKLNEAKAKPSLSSEEKKALDNAWRQRSKEIEDANKERITQEVRKELGEEFDKWDGEEFYEEREEDNVKYFRNPTKGEEEVEKRIRALKNGDAVLQAAAKADSEARELEFQKQKAIRDARDDIDKAKTKEAKAMESLMTKLEKETKGQEEGKLGDGKPGNGVKTADGKTRLRLEDFAYLINSIQMDDFEYGDQEDDTDNPAEVTMNFRSGINDEAILPFTFYIERSEEDDTEVVGYDSERFNIEEDVTRIDRYIPSVSLDVNGAGEVLRKAGFTFDDKDLESFASGFDRVAQKRAPDFESEWESKQD